MRELVFQLQLQVHSMLITEMKLQEQISPTILVNDIGMHLFKPPDLEP